MLDKSHPLNFLYTLRLKLCYKHLTWFLTIKSPRYASSIASLSPITVKISALRNSRNGIRCYIHELQLWSWKKLHKNDDKGSQSQECRFLNNYNVSVRRQCKHLTVITNDVISIRHYRITFNAKALSQSITYFFFYFVSEIFLQTPFHFCQKKYLPTWQAWPICEWHEIKSQFIFAFL